MFWVNLQDSQPHSRAFSGPEVYTSYITNFSTSWQLKKVLVIPMMHFAFLIWVPVSASSFSSGVMMDLRYLKDLVKLILVLLE